MKEKEKEIKRRSYENEDKIENEIKKNDGMK